jgi:hypothetical protein
MFESLGDEVVMVDVEGWKATALRSTVVLIEKVEVEQSVRLLPMFDVYVLTQSRNIEQMLDIEHKGKVFRPAAWVSAVVLVDGRIGGVWTYETRKGQTVVKVGMFAPAAKKVRSGVEAETQRLEGFLNTNVVVEWVL